MSYDFLRQIADLAKRLDAAEARLTALEAIPAAPEQPEKRKGGWPKGRARKLPGNGIRAVSNG